jgi:REP element-mobilizing transposase RayT
MSEERKPQPLYDPSRVEGAFQLRYSWTGWPSGRAFASTPKEVLPTIKDDWEKDGLRLLESSWTSSEIQLLFSAVPGVSLVLLATRAKGRLDHALRVAGVKMEFSRKLAVRSIGDNTREQVEAYIEQQVPRARFADPRFAEFLKQFTVVNPHVDLSVPSESARGRYWYNLHVVLVVTERYRIVDQARLTTLRDTSLRIAEKKGYAISRLSVMPDHLHAALRGNCDQSPVEIVGAFQNNLAYAVGQMRLWEETYYTGTFSEYDMDAIRRRVAREEDGTPRTAGEAGGGRDRDGSSPICFTDPHKADGVGDGGGGSRA